MKRQSSKTIQDLQNIGQQKLADAVWHPDFEADLLLATTLKKDRSYLYAYPNRLLTPSQYKTFKSLLLRRAKGEPFAYLAGKKEFLGLEFKVDKRVLIPRSETEILAEEAIKLIKTESLKTCVDVGTGSGAIAISVAHRVRRKVAILATDISTDALTVARTNKQSLVGTSRPVSFVTGDLLMPVINKKLAHPLLVVSNPPYLTGREAESSELKYEPRVALSGGDNGLDLIERLLEQFAAIALPGDHLLFEIGALQGKKILSLIKKVIPGSRPTISKDYAGFDRIVHVKI